MFPRSLLLRCRPLSAAAQRKTAVPDTRPYGVGTHTCLGNRWMDLQLTANALIIARHFQAGSVPPRITSWGSGPLPSMKPNKKLRFRIAEQIRELPV